MPADIQVVKGDGLDQGADRVGLGVKNISPDRGFKNSLRPLQNFKAAESIMASGAAGCPCCAGVA